LIVSQIVNKPTTSKPCQISRSLSWCIVKSVKEPKDEIQQWEYRFLNIDTTEEELNSCGSHGWELISSNESKYILKRPKLEEEDLKNFLWLNDVPASEVPGGYYPEYDEDMKKLKKKGKL